MLSALSRPTNMAVPQLEHDGALSLGIGIAPVVLSIRVY